MSFSNLLQKKTNGNSVNTCVSLLKYDCRSLKIRCTNNFIFTIYKQEYFLCVFFLNKLASHHHFSFTGVGKK